jgi:hypothetical protein
VYGAHQKILCAIACQPYSCAQHASTYASSPVIFSFGLQGAVHGRLLGQTEMGLVEESKYPFRCGQVRTLVINCTAKLERIKSLISRIGIYDLLKKLA